MINLEDLYRKLPVPLQQICCSLEGWLINRKRYNQEFFAYLDAYESRPTEGAAFFRDENIRAYLRHCAATIPYYNRQFKKLGIDPLAINTLADLSPLPLLTKAHLQQNMADFVSQSARRTAPIHTSGTTGAGLRFLTTWGAIHQQWALWWRYRRWHGIPFGCWCGYFGGRSVVPADQKKPPFWRMNYPGRQILFSAYHANYENLRHYVAMLRRKKPPWLHGYPSMLSLLACYILDGKVDLGYQPRWITIGAENLLPRQAGLIEHAFGLKPRQHYGLAEAAANISECEHGSLHVDEDFAGVEFIPCGEDGACKIVGTAFTNWATGFVRYDTSDVATLAPEGKRCSCGRGGRMVESIDGRQEDYVVLPNGARVGRLDHIFKDMVNIREAQIYQEKHGAVILRIVRNKNFTLRDERNLLDEARRRLGGTVAIEIDYVAELQRSGRGKFRFVVSRAGQTSLTLSSS